MWSESPNGVVVEIGFRLREELGDHPGRKTCGHPGKVRDL